jgi:hypothetical protein
VRLQFRGAERRITDGRGKSRGTQRRRELGEKRDGEVNAARFEFVANLRKIGRQNANGGSRRARGQAA